LHGSSLPVTKPVPFSVSPRFPFRSLHENLSSRGGRVVGRERFSHFNDLIFAFNFPIHVQAIDCPQMLHDFFFSSWGREGRRDCFPFGPNDNLHWFASSVFGDECANSHYSVCHVRYVTRSN
jgi:hypothetical protein